MTVSISLNPTQTIHEVLVIIFNTIFRMNATIICIIWSRLLITNTNATFQRQLISNDGPITNQYYGAATAISNNTAFIGALGDTGNIGAVYVFNYINSSWQQTQKIKPSDVGGSFGNSIDFDPVNHDLLIGAPTHTNSRGAAYIFNQNISTRMWEETQILLPVSAADLDKCGDDVAIENNIAVIGCAGDNDNGFNNGAVRIYEKSTTWTEIIKIIASDPSTQNGDNFGYSVDISNGVILVGSIGWGGAGQGAAYIIEKDATCTTTGRVWCITHRLAPSDPMDYASFGIGSIDHDRLVVSAYGFNDGVGKVYIYEYNGAQWGETDTITAYDGQSNDHFGMAVVLYDNTLVVGSPSHSDYDTNSGSVYVYQQLNNNWTLTGKLSPTNVSAGAEAGYLHTLSFVDNIILVGAPDNGLLASNGGAAYIYQPTKAPSDAPTFNPTISPTIPPKNEEADVDRQYIILSAVMIITISFILIKTCYKLFKQNNSDTVTQNKITLCVKFMTVTQMMSYLFCYIFWMICLCLNQEIIFNILQYLMFCTGWILFYVFILHQLYFTFKDSVYKMSKTFIYFHIFITISIPVWYCTITLMDEMFGDSINVYLSVCAVGLIIIFTGLLTLIVSFNRKLFYCYINLESHGESNNIQISLISLITKHTLLGSIRICIATIFVLTVCILNSLDKEPADLSWIIYEWFLALFIVINLLCVYFGFKVNQQEYNRYCGICHSTMILCCKWFAYKQINYYQRFDEAINDLNL
eukprot:155749_1